MRVLVVAAIAAFYVATVSAVAPLLHADSPTAIPGRYIVVLKSGSRSLREAHVQRVQSELKATKITQFQIGDFSAYAATLSSSDLAAVQAMDEVAHVEPDQVVRAVDADACTTQSPTPSWGLDRIAEQKPFLDGEYPYPSSAGASVTSYIIDTGIYVSHPDFGGRAKWGINYADNQNTDCNGHGTHVAGTVGGTSFGVAKKTTLIAVKVLDCDGSGTNTGVISGIQWVANQHKTKNDTAVANMSLGGGKSTAINNAVAAAINAGVTMVVAAGNENTDACTTSPASEPLAITVGATNMGVSNTGADLDVRASFSNYGHCVSVFAPGQAITSAWIPPYTQNTISGTSMASPHVAGIAALILDAKTATKPADVKSAIVNGATSGILDLACGNTACKASPNKISYIGC